MAKISIAAPIPKGSSIMIVGSSGDTKKDHGLVIIHREVITTNRKNICKKRPIASEAGDIQAILPDIANIPIVSGKTADGDMNANRNMVHGMGGSTTAQK